MKLITSQASLRRLLRWTQRVLFAVGLWAITYCGVVLMDTWLFQRRANRELERELRQAAISSHTTAEPSKSTPAVIGPDGLIGRLEIPRLHLSAITMEGTDRATLRRAVGHIHGTALPGAPGNVGLAGHRDTFFRGLKDIQLRDLITLQTPTAEYRYVVVSTRIVDPSEVSVLDPTAEETLTLVTCYPFQFTGPAPDRFIVRASRVRSTVDTALFERGAGRWSR